MYANHAIGAKNSAIPTPAMMNGAPVEKFVDGDAPAHEREIVHGASIRLADAVTLELLLR